MKKYKKLTLLLTFILVGLYSSMIYANDQVIEGENIKVVSVVKDDKKTEYLESEDGYIRITQPTKAAVFESKINVMGETKEGTKLVIKLNSVDKDKEDKYIVLDTKSYEYTVGSTGTFNQLIELFEGKNQIVVKYTNEKDKTIDGKMVYVVKKESKETKESIEKLIVYPKADDLKPSSNNTAK